MSFQDIVNKFNNSKLGEYSSLTISNTINHHSMKKIFAIDEQFKMKLTDKELIITGGQRDLGTHYYKLENIDQIELKKENLYPEELRLKIEYNPL